MLFVLVLVLFDSHILILSTHQPTHDLTSFSPESGFYAGLSGSIILKAASVDSSTGIVWELVKTIASKAPSDGILESF